MARIDTAARVMSPMRPLPPQATMSPNVVLSGEQPGPARRLGESDSGFEPAVAARSDLYLHAPYAAPEGQGHSPAARHHVSTEQVPAGQRAAYWLETICNTLVGLEYEPDAEVTLHGEITFLRLGCLTVGNIRSNASRVRRTPERIRRDRDSYYLIQIQREGTGIVCQDGRSAVLKPGDFALHDSTRPFELVFGDHDHDVTTLRLPCSALDIHVSNIQELTATTIDGSAAAGQLLGSMVTMLARDFSRLPAPAALSLSEAITSMVAAGLRSLPMANVKRPTSLHAYHVARIQSYVREHLRDPDLSVASIARALDMSADHLSRIFKHEPIPLSRLIWQSRLAACTQDLRDPRLRHRTVSEIAFAWGFNDAAHFSRAFKECHGTSPRQWRAAQTS